MDKTLAELADESARAAYEATQAAITRRDGDSYRTEMLAEAAAHVALVHALVAAHGIAPARTA
ncbi:hypothetical protein ACH4MG_38405 [Streptomyces sp. NPDC017454]|uniref:hypothetical protein n=1 Tax=Streptomyces sp. NPDC017454 TaxID=3364997 RepID=UPI0037B3BB83